MTHRGHGFQKVHTVSLFSLYKVLAMEITALTCIGRRVDCLRCVRHVVLYPASQVAPRWLFLRVETANGFVGWGEPNVEGFSDTVEAAVLLATCRVPLLRYVHDLAARVAMRSTHGLICRSPHQYISMEVIYIATHMGADRCKLYHSVVHPVGIPGIHRKIADNEKKGRFARRVTKCVTDFAKRDIVQ